MANVTLGGNPITVAGKFPQKGDTVADFSLTAKDLKDLGLKDFAGKRKVLNIVPSLDTAVCAKSTKVFNEKAGSLLNTVVLVISGGLTARAVIVLDEKNKVLHSELVPEIKQEPNYDAALAALK